MLIVAAFVAAALAGDATFDEGVRLYKALEYEQSIFRFEELAARAGLAPSDKAEAFMWLGLAYAGTGDFDAARRTLADAVRADPAVTLPATTSPRVVALFDEVKAAATPAATPEALKPQPPDPPPPAEEGGAVLPGAVVAAGVVSLALGGLLAAVSVDNYGKATAPLAFQDEAKAAADAMNVDIIGASVLLPLGAVLTGVGALLLLSDDTP